MLMTLQEFLSGDTMSVMAARLHVHPKTLAFRKRKIEKLLQIDLDDPEQRLILLLPSSLKQLRKK
jgi:DNA-binding PucR family transcriptional regulator